MPDYTTIDPANLKPYERRQYIAWRVLGSPGKVMQKQLADELGVSEATISFDMDSPEYLAAAGECFREMVKKHLLPQALMNVAKQLQREAQKDFKYKPDVSIELIKLFGHLFIPPAKLQVEDVTRMDSPSDGVEDEIKLAVADAIKNAYTPLELPAPKPGNGNGNGNDSDNGTD